MLLYISLFLLVFQHPTYSKDWEKVGEKDGVEMYVHHKSSNISSSVSSIIKLKNTNIYEVKVVFQPSITCEENVSMQQAEKSVILAPNDESSLHHYKVCTGENISVTLTKLIVTKL